MENIVFNCLYKSLIKTVNNKMQWVEMRDGIINNDMAKKYFELNSWNVDKVFVDFMDAQTVILLKEGNPIYFYNENGGGKYQIKNDNDIENFLLHLLVKIIQKEHRITELECKVSDLEKLNEIYRDDNVLKYKTLYEESESKIKGLKKKLEKKTKAYSDLKVEYEKLLERSNWDI